MTVRARDRSSCTLRYSRLPPPVTSTRVSPLVGANSPVIILNVDVLPAPLMPRRPKHCPRGMPTDKLRTAFFAPDPNPNVLVIPWRMTPSRVSAVFSSLLSALKPVDAMSLTRRRSSATSSSSASSTDESSTEVFLDLILKNSSPLDASVAMLPSESSTSMMRMPNPTARPTSHAMSSPMTSSAHQSLLSTGARLMVCASKRWRFSFSLFWPMSYSPLP
mmetsp:Transcript_6995/g.28980  ORF Transcript_6995/g.28980 Transcript_6995/m.28980 type:complete len:219 (-) Transcript_6995:4449-5105(-)